VTAPLLARPCAGMFNQIVAYMCKKCFENEEQIRIKWRHGLQVLMPALQEMAARLGLTVKKHEYSIIVSRYYEDSLYYFVQIQYRQKWVTVLYPDGEWDLAHHPTKWQYTIFRNDNLHLTDKELGKIHYPFYEVPVKGGKDILLKEVEQYLTMFPGVRKPRPRNRWQWQKRWKHGWETGRIRRKK